MEGTHYEYKKKMLRKNGRNSFVLKRITEEEKEKG